MLSRPSAVWRWRIWIMALRSASEMSRSSTAPLRLRGNETQVLVDLTGRGGQVQRVEVQPWHAFGEQLLAQLGGHVDADAADVGRVVVALESGDHLGRDLGAGQLRHA